MALVTCHMGQEMRGLPWRDQSAARFQAWPLRCDERRGDEAHCARETILKVAGACALGSTVADVDLHSRTLVTIIGAKHQEGDLVDMAA